MPKKQTTHQRLSRRETFRLAGAAGAMALIGRQIVGEPVAASPVLFEAVRFALCVAEETGGAFDPTIGRRMEMRGFNREDRSGRTVCSPVSTERDVTYRDVDVNVEQRTITLGRPLVLDLGAVAKGLAVDAPARFPPAPP